MIAGKGNRPNFLFLMVDEMRHPPVHATDDLKQFRATYLKTQNALRATGVEFQLHYAGSVACTPGRATLYTGKYPSLHGVSQTTGAAKESFDPDVFWLDPNSVPTMGDYFRAAGYTTFWKARRAPAHPLPTRGVLVVQAGPDRFAGRQQQLEAMARRRVVRQSARHHALRPLGQPASPRSGHAAGR